MVSAIDIQAHFSSHYKPRTLVNAAQADLTVAFALDYDSPGERLTRKAAGERYAAIPLGADPLESARALYRHLRAYRVRQLNVAGNGLSTLARHGWTQARHASLSSGVTLTRVLLSCTVLLTQAGWTAGR